MSRKLISIIVPVYNVEKYINQCLDSLVNQTYKELEIILIDDGSTDKSGNICDEYALKDSRIKVIHQKNAGVSVARNRGLDMLTGDYVMFVDSDDWIELDTCEILLNRLNEETCDILVFNMVKEYENNSVKMPKYVIDDYDNLARKVQAKILSPSLKIPNFHINQIGFACGKIISAKLVQKQRFVLENKKAIFEDGLFYYNLFEKTNEILFCNNYLYHYRILNGSAVRGYNDDFPSIVDIINSNILELKNNHLDDIYYEQSLNIRNLMNFCTMMNVFINKNSYRKSINARINLIKKELCRNNYRNINSISMKNLNVRLKIYYLLIKLKLYYFIIFVNNIEQIIKLKIKT